MLDAEIKLAIKRVKEAENRFNNANEKNINHAISELLEAEEELNQLIKKKQQKIIQENEKKEES